MADFYLNPPLKQGLDEWPEHWPQWVKEALDELEHIENRFPKDILNGAPKWVTQMSLRIVQLMHPATKYSAQTNGAAFLGSTLGHLMWLMESKDGLSAMMDRLQEADDAILSKLRDELSPEDYEKKIDELSNSEPVTEFRRLSKSFIRLLIRKRKVLIGCSTFATGQDIEDQAEFYAAYANALKKPPMDEKGALTQERFPNTGKIYFLMAVYWKHVSKLSSGAKCHAWLCSLLGENIVGSKHRIEKMCYAFGINFSHRKRKPRKKKRRNRK